MKLKVLTILGTRPEIIRLSQIINLLDKNANHKIIHTGQNFDYNLDKIFFNEFNIRKPNFFLDARGSFAQQIGKILIGTEKIIKKFNPDRFLVLGDTNSSLAAISAKRLGVTVYHMEAGNRSYIKNSPEEVNRKIIDHSSDIFLPYTYRSAENLKQEGVSRNKIFVTGNPIGEILLKYEQKIDSSRIMKKLGLTNKNFFLLTLHREENVDKKENLKKNISIITHIVKKYKKKLIWPIHPRTKKNIVKFNIKIEKKFIKLVDPLGFFDFTNLEKNSLCTLTDSGTVQEECAIFKVPGIILRENTERPETIESGSSIINDNIFNILQNIEFSINTKNESEIPDGYNKKNVSTKVVKIITSKILV